MYHTTQTQNINFDFFPCDLNDIDLIQGYQRLGTILEVPQHDPCGFIGFVESDMPVLPGETIGNI